jgi:phage I-like protein
MDATHFMTIADLERSGPLAAHGAALEDAAVALDEAPEWVMLIPAGEFAGRDGRGPFRLASPARVIAATVALSLRAGVPIDYDHATEFAAPRGRPAPAAGWIREFAEREGALWGRVEWTPHGARAITSREYRYLSPVFQHAADGTVIRLLRAGLTNNPNLYLTAISARALEPPANTTSGADSGACAEIGEGDHAMETLLKELREMLGLNDEAVPAEVLAAVRALSEDARRFSRDDGGDDDDDESDDDGLGDGDRLESRHREAGATGAGVDPARFVAVA